MTTTTDHLQNALLDILVAAGPCGATSSTVAHSLEVEHFTAKLALRGMVHARAIHAAGSGPRTRYFAAHTAIPATAALCAA